MNFKKVFVLVATSLLLSGCQFSLASLKSNKKSGLQVTSTPQATVFMDGNSLGVTPLIEEDLKPGDYTLKITPNDAGLSPWETKVTLTPGVLTVIDRKLSTSPDQSNGYLMSFERLSNSKQVQFAVTTIPDSVTVTIDGNPQGFTPLSLDTLTEGDHTILLSSPGFEDKLVRARTVAGFRLTLSAQLAKQALTPTPEVTPLATPSATPTPSLSPTTTPKVTLTPTPTKVATSSATTTPAKPYAEVLSTPTGWLRVRATPGGEEVGKVNTGDKLPFSATSDDSQWQQIEYLPGKQGWVASQYVKIVR